MKKILLIMSMIIMVQAAFAQLSGKNFYFLPPNTQEWISAIPYMATPGGDIVNMDIAPDMCGWYIMVYSAEEPPSGVLIGRGPNLKAPIGSGLINLAEKFASLGNNIYFNAEDDTWSINSPLTENKARCQYTMAAVIYDTDPSVHPDFSCGVYLDEDNCTEAPANTNKKSRCGGVRKGLVKPNLNPDTKKIEYSGVDPQGCWTSKSWFDTAFKSSPSVNVTHCYDMPFGKQNSGFWEFDSDKLLNAHGMLVGGFFPEILHNAPVDPSCPSCNTKRTAEVFTPIHEKLTAEIFDSYVSKEGDFASGNDSPPLSAMLPGATENTVWNWGNGRDGRNDLTWYLHGTSGTKGSEKSKANQHFCFESHATFTYDPAHEFYFRGDDAIWVYINNQLVVDLGGTHMAAPGHVKLKDMVPALEVDKEYPIDIFFCDMRTTQSNVRIKSNIYFAQKAVNGEWAGLFIGEENGNSKTLCLREAVNTCTALLGGSVSTEPICGTTLAPRISYHIEIPGYTNVDLATAPACDWSSATQGVCYGGIVLDNGTVTINEANMMAGLMELGFELFVSVEGYGSINVSKAVPTPVITRAPQMLHTQEPVYYTLKGEPLGSKKPGKPGVYIVRQRGINKVVVVK